MPATSVFTDASSLTPVCSLISRLPVDAHPMSNLRNTSQTTAPMTMSSLELVDFISSQRAQGEPELTHANFLAKVPKVLGEASHSFECNLPDGYGRPRRGYRFPKREACLMAMSYSYELQAKVFDRMTALEAQASPALPDFTNPAAAARAWAEQYDLSLQLASENKTQAEALALAAPKVEYVNRYVASNGAMGFRQVAKLLKANEHEFRSWLQDQKIMYRLGGEWAAYQNHIDAGRFVVKSGVASRNEHAFSRTMFTPKGFEWAAGEWGKHKAKLATVTEA